MKFNGAYQPHRADSKQWNDSFGGQTVQNSYCNNNQTVYQKSNYYVQYKTDNYSYDTKTDKDRWSAGPPVVGNQSSIWRATCKWRQANRSPWSRKGSITTAAEAARSPAKRNIFEAVRSVLIGSKMIQIQQSSLSSSSLPSSTCPIRLFSFFHPRQSFFTFPSNPLIFIILLISCTLINNAVCDENDDGASLGPPEFTTVITENTTRGNKKFGDRCEETWECGFAGSICDSRKKSCQCIEDLPVTNHLDKCGKEAAINESCFFNEQCEAFHFQTECRDNRCVCRFEMSPVVNKDGNVECKGKQTKHEVERYVDPAMIGILVAMALMFIIICVVLRLFSRARWSENRTIFNTPNPRLMNVSLLRENKLLHGQERRGSRMSVRAPSRQPSMASLRPHSPNPSLGNERRGQRGKNAAKTNDSRFSEYTATGNHIRSNDNTATNNVPNTFETTATVVQQNHVKTNKF